MRLPKLIAAVFLLYLGYFGIGCSEVNLVKPIQSNDQKRLPGELCFATAGQSISNPRKCITGDTLLSKLTPVEVAVEDPVYRKKKRYRGFWLKDLIQLAGPDEDSEKVEFVALDGYTERYLNFGFSPCFHAVQYIVARLRATSKKYTPNTELDTATAFLSPF